MSEKYPWGPIGEDFTETLLERRPYCIVVPAPDGGIDDIIGPFATKQEADNWALSYPGAEVASMSTPELEISLRRDHELMDAANKPKH